MYIYILCVYLYNFMDSATLPSLKLLESLTSVFETPTYIILTGNWKRWTASWKSNKKRGWDIGQIHTVHILILFLRDCGPVDLSSQSQSNDIGMYILNPSIIQYMYNYFWESSCNDDHVTKEQRWWFIHDFHCITHDHGSGLPRVALRSGCPENVVYTYIYVCINM